MQISANLELRDGPVLATALTDDPDKFKAQLAGLPAVGQASVSLVFLDRDGYCEALKALHHLAQKMFGVSPQGGGQ